MADTKQMTKKLPQADDTQADDAAPQPINLQKRKGEVEATRYGDWELNGRCIDF